MIPKRSTFAKFVVACCCFPLLVAMTSCSDEDKAELDDASQEVEDAAREAGESIDSVVDDASAMSIAETLAASIESDDGASGADAPSADISVVEENVADLPGEPEIDGLEDADDDGLDDDLQFTVTVDDSTACLQLSDEDLSVDVQDDAC